MSKNKLIITSFLLDNGYDLKLRETRKGGDYAYYVCSHKKISNCKRTISYNNGNGNLKFNNSHTNHPKLSDNEHIVMEHLIRIEQRGKTELHKEIKEIEWEEKHKLQKWNLHFGLVEKKWSLSKLITNLKEFRRSKIGNSRSDKHKDKEIVDMDDEEYLKNNQPTSSNNIQGNDPIKQLLQLKQIVKQ